MHQIHTCGTRKDKIQDYKSIKKNWSHVKKQNKKTSSSGKCPDSQDQF